MVGVFCEDLLTTGPRRDDVHRDTETARSQSGAKSKQSQRRVVTWPGVDESGLAERILHPLSDGTAGTVEGNNVVYSRLSELN